jgi:hypothetical protein
LFDVGVADATLPIAAGGSQARARSDDEESVASFASRSSVASTASREKKRKLASMTPDVSEELTLQVRKSSAADVSAEVIRQLSEVMRVATTSSNLKETCIKTLKDAVSYITAAWTNESSKRMGATRLADARMAVLEEENAALRNKLSRRAAYAHECLWCDGSAFESDRLPREGKSESARLAALERRVEEIGPSIIRVIEERFGGRRLRSPETWQRRSEPSATGCTAAKISPPPRELEGSEWKVVASKGAHRKEAKKRKTPVAREATRKEGRAAAPSSSMRHQQQPQTRTTGAPKSSGAATPKKGPTPTSKTAMLPRTPRTSAVTLTLSEGSKMSYAEVISTARRNIPLAEIGVKSVDIRKAMTGAIIIKVPGNKGREKASRFVCLTRVLDPTMVKVAVPTRMAELRVAGIDISNEKEELRQALSLATGCGGAEVQVG